MLTSKQTDPRWCFCLRYTMTPELAVGLDMAVSSYGWVVGWCWYLEHLNHWDSGQQLPARKRTPGCAFVADEPLPLGNNHRWLQAGGPVILLLVEIRHNHWANSQRWLLSQWLYEVTGSAVAMRYTYQEMQYACAYGTGSVWMLYLCTTVRCSSF